MNSFARAMTPSSLLPEMYHITTRSPSRMVLPPSSTSRVAVRAMWITGDCQRIISLTMFGMLPGFRLSFSYSCGCSFSARIPPEIELRVVSFPAVMSMMDVAHELALVH